MYSLKMLSANGNDKIIKILKGLYVRIEFRE